MKKALIACISCLLLTSSLSLTVHAELPEPNWQLGINDWGFFGIGAGVDVSETDREKLRSQLKNTELYTAETVLARTKAGGGCYGKSVTSILSAYGLIDYSLYTHENGTVPRGLTDIGFPYLSDTGDISDVTVPSAALSLIQYYHCLASSDEIQQYCAWMRYSTTKEERVKMLLEKLKSGKPVLVIVSSGEVPEGPNSHAVVAYGVEDGSWDRGYMHFDKRILTYDPNFPRKTAIRGEYTEEWMDQNMTLYLNSETGDWRLGWFGNSYGGTHYGDKYYERGYLDAFIDDINLLNHKGLLEGTEPYVSDKPFLGVMTSNWIKPKHKLQKISQNDGMIEILGDADYMETPAVYSDNNPNTALNYLTEDTDSGYCMTLDEPQELETVMFYENSIGKAQSESAFETAVTPEGYVAVKGDFAPYTLEYCLNEGYYTGAWCQLSVQGTASEAALRMTEDGWLLTADSLYRTHIRTKTRSRKFHDILLSTDAQTLRISESDDGIVSAMADRDGDGIFETELTDFSGQLGDVDGNQIVNSADATEILKASARIGTGKPSGMDETQTVIADVDGNGKVNAVDATQILVYAAKVGCGYTGSLWQFIGENS